MRFAIVIVLCVIVLLGGVVFVAFPLPKEKEGA